MATVLGTATVCWRFQETAARHGEAIALRTLDGRTWSWRQYAAEVRSVAAALSMIGLGRGDVAACWLGNRPEFHVADAAAMHLGMASFSLPATCPDAEAERVLADAGARVLVTEQEHADAAIAMRDGGATALEHIVLVDGDAPQALGWDELRDFAPADFDFDAAWHRVAPEDLATLSYAPGAARDSELTHAHAVARTVALTDRLRVAENTRAVSFLPMADLAERLSTHYLAMVGGWEVTCCPDAGRVADAIRAARPGYLSGPPRLWQQLRAALLDSVTTGSGPDGDRWRAALERIGLDALEAAVVAPAGPKELIAFWRAVDVPLRQAEVLDSLSTSNAGTHVADAT